MSRFTPYTPSTRLPDIGQGYEKATIDLKETYQTPSGKFSDYHIAKDVAALANGIGGTILVGAVEGHPAGVVARYAPLANADATAHTKAIDNAVAGRCRPRPLHAVERLSSNAKTVLAVNVWPYPPGGVAVRADADPNADYGGDSWVFPVRLNERTVYFEPDRIPMLMLPELRRIVTLLRSVGPNELVELTHSGGTGRIVDVRELENSVVLEMEPTKGRNVIPLDYVRSIHKDGARWRMSLK